MRNTRVAVRKYLPKTDFGESQIDDCVISSAMIPITHMNHYRHHVFE